MGLRRTSTDQRANIGFLLEEHILPVEDSQKEVQSHQAIRATSCREILMIEHLGVLILHDWRTLSGIVGAA